MLKVKYKNLFLIKFLVFLLVLMGLTLTPAKAHAATFYETSSTAHCSSEDFSLNPPYKSSDGQTFYCVSNLGPREYSAVTSSNPCPSGTAVAHKGAFNLCLDNLNQGNLTTASTFATGSTPGEHQCGTGASAAKVSIDFGCKGEVCVKNPHDTICSKNINPILDALFAIIRLLSIGVGLVIITSTIVAGIQYTASRGDPQATAAAIGRITNTMIALLIYIFAYAIINWLVPAGLLR